MSIQAAAMNDSMGLDEPIIIDEHSFTPEIAEELIKQLNSTKDI